jgi:ATP-binding cassette subfamily F protein 3
MLSIQNITKSFGIDNILNGISFSLNDGERLGLVGPNGCGKTTLLRIIVGQENADSGIVRFNPTTLSIGYLPQGAEFNPQDTLDSYLHRCEGDLPALSRRLETLASGLTREPNNPAFQSEYDDVLRQIQLTSESAGRGMAVMAGLGLDLLPPDLPVSSLSGGQKTRLALAGVLLSNPRLLLLDEPTNHLDIEMLEWLEGWLLSYHGGLLIVSHDRAFLDYVATSILEIDGVTHKARVFDGNYSAYLEEKMAERERQWQAYTDQQDEISRLRKSASQVRSRAKFHKGGKADPANTDGFSAGFFANRAKETIQRAKNIEKRIERLLTEERVDKPAQTWEMKMDFGEILPTGRDVIILEDLTIGYGQHALLTDLNLTLRYGSRTVLTGPNGCGKTTLLRTIAGQIPPLNGSSRLGSRVKLGYMAQEQENLDSDLNAFDTIQRMAGLPETETRAFLSLFLFKGNDVFVPVGSLSFGERARLSLACLVAQGCNLLLLDEPINHLDIPSRTRFEQSLAQFKGSILAVVHDRYFIDGFASELWEVAGQEIRFINLHTSYRL